MEVVFKNHCDVNQMLASPLNVHSCRTIRARVGPDIRILVGMSEQEKSNI